MLINNFTDYSDFKPSYLRRIALTSLPYLVLIPGISYPAKITKSLLSCQRKVENLFFSWHKDPIKEIASKGYQAGISLFLLLSTIANFSIKKVVSAVNKIFTNTLILPSKLEEKQYIEALKCLLQITCKLVFLISLYTLSFELFLAYLILDIHLKLLKSSCKLRKEQTIEGVGTLGLGLIAIRNLTFQRLQH